MRTNDEMDVGTILKWKSHSSFTTARHLSCQCRAQWETRGCSPSLLSVQCTVTNQGDLHWFWNTDNGGQGNGSVVGAWANQKQGKMKTRPNACWMWHAHACNSLWEGLSFGEWVSDPACNWHRIKPGTLPHPKIVYSIQRERIFSPESSL